MISNMLKSLIENGSIETTLEKAKILRSYADQMITLGKKNTLPSRRKAIGEMMIRFNPLTPKEAKAVKNGDTSAYNRDRKIISKLFGELAPRFANRQGGYTRIIRMGERLGDGAQKCIIEYLQD
jgi:large subunit ribosomal protein L17